MKILEGWRKMSHERGFQNETTGQMLTVKKKEFGAQFIVWIIPNEAGEAEGKKISPEFATEVKAQAFALDWMQKNPKGAI
jgi:hypothetical protein